MVTNRLKYACLLYTSDAADDLIGVDLGGRRIIKKKSLESVRQLLSNIGKLDKEQKNTPVSYTHLTLPTT